MSHLVFTVRTSMLNEHLTLTGDSSHLIEAIERKEADSWTYDSTKKQH
ncbi:hypothetical protein RISK_001641 [Rhodopirellula islandica]|uniref:Uncharacterized protein n=1 Tax=Rhodopirellula islandica TaxID=595434 RepID=A0A0J1BIS2_RHOIS|nr:hypothetical protein RISK_001641 [Rhodopirellula islandica]